jgi:hypothetical protein
MKETLCDGNTVALYTGTKAPRKFVTGAAAPVAGSIKYMHKQVIDYNAVLMV